MRRVLLIGAAALAFPQAAAAQVQLNGPTGPASLSVVSYRDLPFRTVVRQQYDYSCGSAALATLLRHHYGRDVDERDVFESMFATGDQAQIRQVGFSLLDMKRYLAGHGFESDGFRMDIDALAASEAPAIVLINQNGYRHFVVFKGAEGDRLLIGDPALGLKIYTRAEFVGIWNGVAFMVREAPAEEASDSDWKPWASPPLQTAMPAASLASLTQQLPPLYQITTSFSLDSVLR
jgi:uncharacterized protein